MKKVLIIGHKGFIGSNLFSHLMKNSYAVTGIDKEDELEIFMSQKFDICVNCAGSSNVSQSFDAPDHDFELNVKLVEKIIFQIRDFNKDCKLINISSAAVYGDPAKLPVKESDEKRPLSPYGMHKLLSEKMLKDAFLIDKLKTISLRVFSIYGEGQKKLLFWDLFQKMKFLDKIDLFGSGKESRDFINIFDFCRLFEIVEKNAVFDGRAVNVASGKEVLVEDAVKIFAGLMNWNGKIYFSNKSIEGYPKNWCADISEIKKLGFKTEISFSEGLKRYIDWANKLD